jgi:hypothetical protein
MKMISQQAIRIGFGNGSYEFSIPLQEEAVIPLFLENILFVNPLL